jgi:hypothetical protein
VSGRIRPRARRGDHTQRAQSGQERKQRGGILVLVLVVVFVLEREGREQRRRPPEGGTTYEEALGAQPRAAVPHGGPAFGA